MKNTANELMETAARTWRVGNIAGMTGSELELARAYFQNLRNSRQVLKINEVLRTRLLARLRKDK